MALYHQLDFPSTFIEYPVVQFRNEQNLIFQVGLEFGTVSAPEIRSIR